MLHSFASLLLLQQHCQQYLLQCFSCLQTLHSYMQLLLQQVKMEEEQRLDVFAVFCIVLLHLVSIISSMLCSYLMLQGSSYYNELLESSSIAWFWQVAHIDVKTFLHLLFILRQNGLSSTERVDAGEKLLILLHTLAGNSNCNTQEWFQHSGSSISLYIPKVIAAILQIQKDYIKLPATTTVLPQIINNPKYYPYFKDCLGAIDGTHVAVSVWT